MVEQSFSGAQTRQQLRIPLHRILDLLSLDVSKSNGPDGISPTMLKHTAGSIASSLTKVLNLSIRLGQLPSQWKQSLIVPIPKTSPADSPSCYRPISLLPVVSKILEQHICDLLQDHLQSLNFISDKQWGFQEGRSTVTALIKCTDDWLKELEVGNDICAVFFDFRKALIRYHTNRSSKSYSHLI